MNMFRPPAGRAFYCSERVPLIVLARDIRQVAAFLQTAWPNVPLNLFADWWQHDGLHFHKDVITFHLLFKVIGSPQAIYAAMPGDDAVRIGVAPLGGEWYLRFYAAWDADGEQIEGDYDLTLPLHLADIFRANVQATLSVFLAEADADAYFKEIILPSHSDGRYEHSNSIE